MAGNVDRALRLPIGAVCLYIGADIGLTRPPWLPSSLARTEDVGVRTAPWVRRLPEPTTLDLVEVDVEGGELSVLEGTSPSLSFTARWWSSSSTASGPGCTRATVTRLDTCAYPHRLPHPGCWPCLDESRHEAVHSRQLSAVLAFTSPHEYGLTCPPDARLSGADLGPASHRASPVPHPADTPALGWWTGYRGPTLTQIGRPAGSPSS